MQISVCDPQFQRDVRHLHHLGPRAIAEFLIALATSPTERDRLLRLLDDYARRSPGLHLVFRWRAGIVTVGPGRIGQGVELRSSGASAIYWPALGFPLLCAAAAAELPAWLLPPAPPLPHLRCEPHGPRPAAHVEAALAGLARAVAGAQEGARNLTAFSPGFCQGSRQNPQNEQMLTNPALAQ